MPNALKQYLGDSVYADFDGYHVVLTTENGGFPTNKIMLEPDLLINLNRYCEWLKEKKEKETNATK